MAKKLVYNYTFDASAQTIVISGNFKLRTIQLITNVTDGIIIYNFADPAKGGSISYDSTNDQTTITLDHNTTSMSDSDELQIFVDIPEDKVEFGETFVDPVSKLRVTNPENLIDTDFEYGLQPTKWETVELVNNIPSAYTRAPGVSIPGIVSVLSTLNSELITVTTAEEHGLSIGDPIEVRGLSSRTANGKYLITQVPSTTKFNYKASAIQSSAGDKLTAYTTIIPGSFFTGSSIPYDKFEGVNTDDANPSTLTVTTDYAHGFSTSTSMYITNTVGKKELTLSNTTTSTAPDGDPYVDTTADDIYLPLHGLYNDQQVTLSLGSGGAVPGTTGDVPNPNTSTICQAAFDAAESWADTKAASMISAQDHSRLLMNYTGSNEYYMYNDSTISPNGSYGTNITQEFRFGDASTATMYMRQSGGGLLARYYMYLQNFTGPGQLYTGNPVDIGAVALRSRAYSGSTSNYPSNLSNMGFYLCATPYSYNQYTNHITRVIQVPDLVAVNDAVSYGTVDRVDILTQEYNTKVHTLAGSFSSYTNSSWITYNTSWRYVYAVKYLNSGAGEVSSYCIDVWLQNTGWTDYYNDGNAYLYTDNDNLCHNNRDSMGPTLHIQSFFGLDDGHTSGTYANSSNAATNAAGLAQAVADALTPATLSDGDTVKVGVIDDNRIQLRKSDTGTPFNFTSAGTAPLIFTTGQTFGVL